MATIDQIRQYYQDHNKNPRLTFQTFYGRVHQCGWSFEKALNYPVRFLKLRTGANYSKGDVDLYSQIAHTRIKPQKGEQQC